MFSFQWEALLSSPPTLYIYEIEEINLVVLACLTFINHTDWYMSVNHFIRGIYNFKN